MRDKTSNTACLFTVEQNYRVCIAVAETQHAMGRDMYVGKVIPTHRLRITIGGRPPQ